jgi:hypothetical protein
MDVMKHFLDKVMEWNEDYHYDKLDNMAEIYQKGDLFPIALIEFEKGSSLYVIRFRLGLLAHKIGRLAKELALQESCLVFDDDFFIHEQYGYLYGDDARQAFIERIQANAKKNKSQEEEVFGDVIYVSTEPIFTYGKQTFGKTKIEKFWEMNDGFE